jgi:hypothetical protein
MLTGLLPRRRDWRGRPDGRPELLRDRSSKGHRHRLLPECFRRAGTRARRQRNLWIGVHAASTRASRVPLGESGRQGGLPIASAPARARWALEPRLGAGWTTGAGAARSILEE